MTKKMPQISSHARGLLRVKQHVVVFIQLTAEPHEIVIQQKKRLDHSQKY